VAAAFGRDGLGLTAMNETLSGLGPWGAAIASVLTGAVTFWLTRAKREAADRADIASDQARTDTYEMLANANDSLSKENARLRHENGELQRELTKQGHALLTMQRLLRIGATNEQLAHYFAESGLAPLEDDKP
jgi:hypothetical protein